MLADHSFGIGSCPGLRDHRHGKAAAPPGPGQCPGRRGTGRGQARRGRGDVPGVWSRLWAAAPGWPGRRGFRRRRAGPSQVKTTRWLPSPQRLAGCAGWPS